MSAISIVIISAVIGGLIGVGFYFLTHDNNKLNQKPCESCRYYTSDGTCDETLQSYNQVQGTLSLAFMTYLDMNKPEGKMCLSNGECEDIDKAFEKQDWEKLFRYIQKYGAYTTS